jgi:lipopolysaccharide/colanic/teichoic acid biosynthesis glycosyltransferase
VNELLSAEPAETAIDAAHVRVREDAEAQRDTKPSAPGLYGVTKRTVDVGLSMIMLALSAPVLLVAASALVLWERQNPFFVQDRVGQNGRVFRMLKLRTMRHDESGRSFGQDIGPPVAKTPDDPRVTAIGRVLRRTSVDELPQLLNVLLGQMSLVGPRPALPAEVAAYPPSWSRALTVPPGLTGLWQVSGRSRLTAERRASLDRLYLRRRSLGFDTLILVRTVWATISMRGAW